MPKLKTSKTAAKRIRVTKTGKLIALSTGKQHLVRRKSRRTQKNANRPLILAPGDAKKIKRLLPGY